MFTPVTAADLADVPLFAGFDDDDLESIAAHCIRVYVREGIHLIKQGESGFQFFVLLDGSADVVVDGATVASLHKGDVFGEMALLGARTRTADVVATSHLTVATSMVWDFRQITAEHPELGARLDELVRSRMG